MLFALVAGAGTAITPCVLPVLPAILSAGGTGGRRRPLGIVTGLAATFTVAIVLVAQLVRGVGIATGATRTFAIFVLAAFGAVMLLPDLAARIQAPLSRLARFGPTDRGTGFVSGLGVGAALGFVCAPCAGPILAAVTAVSATNGASARIVLVAISYSVGLAAVLLLFALGGRYVLDRIRRRARGPVVERGLGTVLILTAVVMATNLDVRFEEALARSRSLPAILVDPTRSLENSHAVQSRLNALRPASPFAVRQSAAGHRTMQSAGVTAPAGTPAALPRLGAAPDFVDTQRWFNTPGGRPLSLRDLRGKVVLVDFWTYTCINCIRTLPFVEGLYRTYARSGLVVVGVHSPEFAFEQQADNVAAAIHSDGLTYPVVQDNALATWTAYGNQYWPAEYLIDATGQVRHTQFGEGEYGTSEAAVRALLTEAGARALPPPSTAHAVTPSAQLASPETYLDPQRAQGFLTPLRLGTTTYRSPGAVGTDEFALDGTWTVGHESATAVSPHATITAGVLAADVYLVMTSRRGAPRRVAILLDGRPITTAQAGADVRGGAVTVTRQRLYSLVHLPRAERHTVTVISAPGVSAYDFTFG